MMPTGEIGPWSTGIADAQSSAAGDVCGFDAQVRQEGSIRRELVSRSLATAKALAGAIAAAELRRERGGPRPALFAQPTL